MSFLQRVSWYFARSAAMTIRAPKPLHKINPCGQYAVDKVGGVQTEVDETEEDQAASAGQREHSPDSAIVEAKQPSGIL
jgi:hypothetical protein